MKMVDAIPESINLVGHATNHHCGRSMRFIFGLFQLLAERVFFRRQRHFTELLSVSGARHPAPLTRTAHKTCERF
jgi:hypothetical protein